MEFLGIQNLWLFIITSVVLITSPGIDTMLVLNKSVTGGRKVGIYTSLGVSTGILFHTVLGVLGLSLIIAQAAYVFTIIKVVGALYLIYLGVIKLWKAVHTPIEVKDQKTESSAKSYWTGVITNILNPKVAIFFLAFFPQFINVQQGHVSESFLLLGIIFMTITLTWFLLVTSLISIFAPLLLRSKKLNTLVHKLSGIVFLLMGVKLALSSNK